MSQIIKKRIIPILLLVVLCFGMVPTAFAEAEITTIDTSTVTQTDVQGKPDTDITVVPNEDAGDLITDEGPPDCPMIIAPLNSLMIIPPVKNKLII